MSTNRKIAELLGWTHIHDASEPIMLGVPVWRGYPPTRAIIGSPVDIPEYDKSLDLCREFESTITDRVKWLNTIRSIVARRCPMNCVGAPIVSDFDIAMATAAERCECWLRMQS